MQVLATWFDAHGNIDPELDARLELELRLDHKEQAEHLMLVDLARNDIARVCQSGTRKVAELMQVDHYSHIMHLVSRVVGKLRPELDALHAYQACMNMGTLTGAPKIKAMQLIYQFEQQKRHSYGGAVGYLTSDGHFDTCIVIRSALYKMALPIFKRVVVKCWILIHRWKRMKLAIKRLQCLKQSNKSIPKQNKDDKLWLIFSF